MPTPRPVLRRRRARVALWGVLTLLGGCAVVAVGLLIVDVEGVGPPVIGSEEPEAQPVFEEGDLPERPEPEDPDGQQRTLLLATVAEDDGEATSLTLLATRDSDRDAAVVFLPVDTLVPVPGFGSERLGAAYEHGGRDLLHVSVESALGARIDAVAVASQAGLAEFFDRAAPVDVELTERVTDADGNPDVVFDEGVQTLDGDELAALWEMVDDDELDAFSRRRRVLGGVLAAGQDEAVRDRLLGDGPPQLETDADPDWMQDALVNLVSARVNDDVRWSVLPVQRLGSEDGQAAYGVDEDDVPKAIADVLDVREPADGNQVRVQVLDGAGTPSVDEELTARLDDSRFEVALTGTADSSDVTETEILVYDDSGATEEAARALQEDLGVGTIKVMRQPQSVIDLTVVVGADFAAADVPPGTDDGE